ncbi:MAG: hypothetical protein NTY67_05460 [Cyanobacteria bacterium]|nr:hypothetical protein [Cyanobacteriota bacterium]
MAIAVILGANTFGVLYRASGGLVSSVRQGDRRQALEAGQAGTAQLLNQLNQKYPHLLVRDAATGSATAAAAPPEWTSNLPAKVCGDGTSPAPINIRLKSAPPKELTTNAVASSTPARYQLISYDFSGELTRLGGPATIRMRGWSANGRANSIVETQVWISTKPCGGAVGTTGGQYFAGLAASYMQLYDDTVNGNATCLWKGAQSPYSDCSSNLAVNNAALKNAVSLSNTAVTTNLQLTGGKGSSLRFPDFPTMPSSLNQEIECIKSSPTGCSKTTANNQGLGWTIYDDSVIVAGKLYQCINNMKNSTCDPMGPDVAGSGTAAKTKICETTNTGITDCALWRIAFPSGAYNNLVVYGENGSNKYVRIWLTCDKARTASTSTCDANISRDTMGTDRQFHVMDTSGLYARGAYTTRPNAITNIPADAKREDLVSYLGITPTLANATVAGTDPMTACRLWFDPSGSGTNFKKSTRLEIHGSTIEGFFYFPCSYSDLDNTTQSGAYWLLYYKAKDNSPATLNVPSSMAGGVVDQFGNEFYVTANYKFEYAATGITSWREVTN